MKKPLSIGVLGFHGDVIEHLLATEIAAKNIHIDAQATEVRTLKDLENLSALIIPGGESTVLHKLSKREGMFEEMRKIPCIFGTCAGAIMLAKEVEHKVKDQETLECMNITVDRNAYGRQSESFEKEIDTALGKVRAVFIRAPKIISVGENVTVLGKNGEEIIACEESLGKNYYLALTFHPELTSPKFHEYFLTKVKNLALL